MRSRHLLPFAAAGLMLGGGFVSPAPATAAVSYDPEAKTGLIGAPDVRDAFGWTAADLAARASGIVFGHDFWADDTYAVSCGGAEFPVVHHQAYGRFELTDEVVRVGGRGTEAGYHRAITGFRLTGARYGISGTTVPPGVGQPCPEQGRGTTIKRARFVSTTTGWALTAASGDEQRRLLVNQTAAAGKASPALR